VNAPVGGGGAAISARDLTLEYRLVHQRALSLKESFVRFLRGERARVEQFRALDGISFDVRGGEALGVIGHNGSGKTTLLRLLAGVIVPTAGVLDVRGRVSTLIDLGAGFNLELTGEENVYLAGALYGFSRREMRAKFDAIVRFAELERFIGVPVKNYSAGMSARLGFAIATDVDPDVLLVDEVLAVGDESFQTKCLDRMSGFRARGKTMVLVSHDLRTVESFCDRAVLLNHGTIAAQGPPGDVVRAYREKTAGGS
jgi:ABC-type polysaccharide/polyol phosphate transport system ATPase subunit